MVWSCVKDGRRKVPGERDPPGRRWQPWRTPARCRDPSQSSRCCSLKSRDVKSIPKGLFLVVANLNFPQEGQKLAQALNLLLTQIMLREGKCFRSSRISSS